MHTNSHTANICPNDFITSDFSTSAQVSETQPDASAVKKLQSTAAIFPRVPDQTLQLSPHTLGLTWSDKTPTFRAITDSYSHQKKGIRSNLSSDEDPLR